jgi:protein O-mannosyl-transferase
MLRTQRDALLVALGGVIAFLPVLGFGFVYDDGWTIVDNRWLERPLGELVGLLGSGEALAQRMPDATRPVMVLGTAIDRKLFGLWPVGFHLHSLLVYGACAGLSALLAFVLTRRRAVALFAGVFFALAPLHAEPVASINYREDLYATLGVLGALVALLGGGYAVRRAKRGRKRARRAASGYLRSDPDSAWEAVVIGVAFAFALFAKESAVVLLPLLAVAFWLVPFTRRVLRERVRALAALGAALLLWASFRVPLLLRGDDIPLAPARGALQLLWRTARFEVQAVRHALFPWSWSPDPFRQADASALWGLALVLILVAVVLLARRRWLRGAALGIAVALVAPFASSPLARPINEYADRYFVLGVLGGGLFWGTLGVQLLRRLARRTQAGNVFSTASRYQHALFIVCLPLWLPAFRATAIWRDERSLWTAALERNPASARAWTNMARVHRRAGELGAADRAVERALELVPGYSYALVAGAYADLSSGRLEQARHRLAELRRLNLTDTPGFRKAEHCAKLADAEAKRCVGP